MLKKYLIVNEMGPKDRTKLRKQGDIRVDDSWLDKLTGNHTTGIIIALLFVFILIVLTIAMFVYPDSADKIIAGLLSLLFGLLGFYTGQHTKKD